jgi:hypothetical protein
MPILSPIFEVLRRLHKMTTASQKLLPDQLAGLVRGMVVANNQLHRIPVLLRQIE